MKIVTTTIARKNIGEMVDRIKYHGEVFAIGRRGSIDALLIQFPSTYNKELDELTNFNANSMSFEFLKDEPELYALQDLKKRYV